MVKHIGLNAHLLSLGQGYRSAGISWYIYNLLMQLGQSHQASSNFRFTAFLAEKAFQGNGTLQVSHSTLSTASPLKRILWEQLMQPRLLKQSKVDLHHALAFVAPVFSPCPFVTTIYDLSFKRYPEAFKPFNRFYLSAFTAYSAKRAQAIMTISESTRQDVIDFFNIAPEKVHTIYCGVDEAFQMLPEAQVAAFKTQRDLPETFLLFLGTIEPRKNVVSLIKAYAHWYQRDPQAPKLFIGGGKGWYYQQVFELVNQLRLTEQIIFPGYLPQADLPLWYNAATIFVYPSHFEGFGLPVLEAMACGTPVITSNVSSLPEVAGTAGRLVEPTNINQLSEALQEIYTNQSLQKAMAEAGLIQATQFSWQKAALQTLQVYDHTLASL